MTATPRSLHTIHPDAVVQHISDALDDWVGRYRALALVGVRSTDVVNKSMLHLRRFIAFYRHAYGHDRLSGCLRRDVVAWRGSMEAESLAAATINNHMASLSAFTSWVMAQAPNLLPMGDPTRGIGELALPPLEPRTLSEMQIRSLKNICDRLPRFHQCRSRGVAGRSDAARIRSRGRPWRDRAIIFTLLSTGLRREELVRCDLQQLEPRDIAALRVARRARIHRVRGKGKTERTVFLSTDARTALADYLQRERSLDAVQCSEPNAVAVDALFVSANGIPARRPDGRLSPRAINLILAQIGRWHDAEVTGDARKISPLRPHDLRHTFAFCLAHATGADAYELERRLGHRSQRYIQRYTNPPEAVAATYIESF